MYRNKKQKSHHNAPLSKTADNASSRNENNNNYRRDEEAQPKKIPNTVEHSREHYLELYEEFANQIRLVAIQLNSEHPDQYEKFYREYERVLQVEPLEARHLQIVNLLKDTYSSLTKASVHPEDFAMRRLAYLASEFGKDYVDNLTRNNPHLAFLNQQNDNHAQFMRYIQEYSHSNMFQGMETQFFFGRVPQSIERSYRAAGVLLYSIAENTSSQQSDTTNGDHTTSQPQDNDNVYFLLGCEDRSHKEKRMERVWLHFGGKIEQSKDRQRPEQTAIRELEEETVGVLDDHMESIKDQIFSRDTIKVWFQQGKYLLFFVQIPHDASLIEQFQRNIERSKEDEGCDQVELAWIPRSVLQKSYESRSPAFVFNNREERFYRFFMEILGGTIHIVNYLGRVNECIPLPTGKKE